MVAELAAELVTAPLDLDVLAALVAIALVAEVVAELNHRTLAIGVPSSPWCPGGGRRARRGDDAGRAVVVADLVVADHAPLDLDVLAALVAIALVAEVVAEHVTGPGPGGGAARRSRRQRAHRPELDRGGSPTAAAAT